eukprot:scaffold4.g4930.t1
MAGPAGAANAAAAGSLVGETPSGDMLRVREVWQDNLEQEMKLIREIVDEHPFLAMDTEFPGVVARPVGNFKNSGEYHYQTLRLNVDMLKLIQLGLTFTDETGGLPRINNELCVWQFNFREFRVSDDMYAQDSIDLLKQSGIDFAQNEARGIDVRHFGELLTVSGVVLNEDVRWITFHSGYDFGYLLKVLTCAPLPTSETDFFELLKAGSDSLLTSATFLKLADTFFGGLGGLRNHRGVLYGLGADGNNELLGAAD